MLSIFHTPFFLLYLVITFWMGKELSSTRCMLNLFDQNPQCDIFYLVMNNPLCCWNWINSFLAEMYLPLHIKERVGCSRNTHRHKYTWSGLFGSGMEPCGGAGGLLKGTSRKSCLSEALFAHIVSNHSFCCCAD